MSQPEYAATSPRYFGISYKDSLKQVPLILRQFKGACEFVYTGTRCLARKIEKKKKVVFHGSRAGGKVHGAVMGRRKGARVIAAREIDLES